MVAEQVIKDLQDEIKKVKEKIDARNELESQIYSVKGAVAEKDKWEGKIEEEEKESIDEVVKEFIDWLDENQEADKEDFVEKKSDFVEKTREIMTKLQNAKGDDEEKKEEDDSSDEDEL